MEENSLERKLVDQIVHGQQKSQAGAAAPAISTGRQSKQNNQSTMFWPLERPWLTLTLRDTRQKKEHREQIKNLEWSRQRASDIFMSGFVILLSLFGSSLYHIWIVRRSVEEELLQKGFLSKKKEEKKSKQNQQEKKSKKESMQDKRRKKSMQNKKRKKLKQNKKRKKDIEAQSEVSSRSEE